MGGGGGGGTNPTGVLDVITRILEILYTVSLHFGLHHQMLRLLGLTYNMWWVYIRKFRNGEEIYARANYRSSRSRRRQI